MRKGSGLVRDLFTQEDMLELRGNIGIGHVRYPTAGWR
jgi:amidophosphoribosyltransferase